MDNIGLPLIWGFKFPIEQTKQVKGHGRMQKLWRESTTVAEIPPRHIAFLENRPK
jgi:hypothetical protein